MNTHHIAPLTILLSLSLACVSAEPCSDASTTDNTSADTSTDTETDETGSDFADLPSDETDTGPVADMPGDGDGDEQPGAWLVLNLGDDVIGELVAPAADDIIDHEDVFAEGSPAVLRLTHEGFGFMINQFAASFIGFKHDDVLYTEPDCVGTPVDRFATVKQTDNGLSSEDCDAQTAMAMGDGITLHYGYQDVAQPWAELTWPGAVGMVVHFDAFEDRWYGLPLDQDWPAMRMTQSVLHADGSCTNEVRHECSVEFVDLDWTPAPVLGPMRLVSAP